MIRLLLYMCFFLLWVPELRAQATGTGEAAEQKHLIYFTDKAQTPFSVSQPLQFLSAKALERRQRQKIAVTNNDLPVDPAYVARLRQEGVTVWYTSRWFNAAVVACSQEQLAQLQALPFVKASQRLHRTAAQGESKLQAQQKMEVLTPSHSMQTALTSQDYGPAFHQADMLGTVDLHAAGFRGEGMTIAVLDAGFPGVNTLAAFSHLFAQDQLKGTFDFVRRQKDVYGADAHGTAVLSTMAAYAPGKIIGTAYKANYLLLRTEDAASEHHIEEINWLLAAEYADSAGADVINSSLGYTTFEAPSVSYTYNDLNGNTTLVSRAADLAAAKGMLVVVSAGNDGNKTWRYVGAPADADSVLAVGAVDSLGRKAPFSSFGPTADGRIKPDVTALGWNAYLMNTAGAVVKSNGTSFAAPIIAGFAAALWQASPDKTNYEMIVLLRAIGSNAANPDNSLGYGIPHYSRMVTAVPEMPVKEAVLITNPVANEEVVLTFSGAWTQQQATILIFDATGKQVFSQELPPDTDRHTLRLQAHQLRRGLYLCRIRSGKLSTTVRFVKL